LNDETQIITGSETYYLFQQLSRSLKYLWLQLDQNIKRKDNNTSKTATNSMRDSIPTRNIAGTYPFMTLMVDTNQIHQGCYRKTIPFTINKTMMRLDLANH